MEARQVKVIEALLAVRRLAEANDPEQSSYETVMLLDHLGDAEECILRLPGLAESELTEGGGS